MAMQEAKSEFGKMLRWTEVPKDQEQGEKTLYLGPVVQGYYTDKRDDVGTNNSTVYEIQLDDGSKVGLWGSGLIDDKMRQIPMGVMVRITYKGVAQPKKPGGRPYADFSIQFDETMRAPMQTAGATPNTSEDVDISQSGADAMSTTPTQPLPQQPAPAPASSDQGY